MNKFKSYFIIWIVIVLQVACNNGGGAPNSAPNSLNATVISLNTPSYTDGSAAINNLVSYSNSLYLLNMDGNIWRTIYNGTNSVWTKLVGLPNSVATTIALNPLGNLFACSEMGNCYLYTEDNWLEEGGGTESSTPSSMLVTNGNDIYMGNAAGHVWYYSNSIWSNISAASGINSKINQLAVDGATPSYLGVASGSSVYAYRISDGSWSDLIAEASSQYTDSGSTINTITFYSDGRNDYGYFGNSFGNVWRAIYDTATGKETSFLNMNISYPGFSGSGAINIIIADSNNNLYVGTADGQVLIWTPNTIAWSNITPTGNTAAISALSIHNSNTVFAGTQDGQMWALVW
ncbi:MAG: hypothetical protein KBD37_04870 [Burkholderiales bacterium]|nr:hypothetical protein [Burkholderiales bacterium]